MYRERFLLLIEHLENHVCDNDFNLSTWAGTDDRPWKGKQDLSCGTVGCAIGHGVSIPAFQKLGLSLRFKFPERALVRYIMATHSDFML